MIGLYQLQHCGDVDGAQRKLVWLSTSMERRRWRLAATADGAQGVLSPSGEASNDVNLALAIRRAVGMKEMGCDSVLSQKQQAVTSNNEDGIFVAGLRHGDSILCLGQVDYQDWVRQESPSGFSSRYAQSLSFLTK